MIPDVRVYEQFDDVCAGMDCVGRKLVDFDVDFTKIYLGNCQMVSAACKRIIV